MTSLYYLVCLPPRGRMGPDLSSRFVFCCSCGENTGFPTFAWVLFSLADQIADGGMVYASAVAPVWRSGKKWPTRGKEKYLEFSGRVDWLAERVATFHSCQDTCEGSSPSRMMVPGKIRIRNFILHFIKLGESPFSAHFQDHCTWKKGDSLNMTLPIYCLFKICFKIKKYLS